jgi:hypothetical protein
MGFYVGMFIGAYDRRVLHVHARYCMCICELACWPKLVNIKLYRCNSKWINGSSFFRKAGQNSNRFKIEISFYE